MSDLNRDVAIHVSIKAVVWAAISLGGCITGAAWSVSATNTHVAEALKSMEQLDAQQSANITNALSAANANGARIDVLDSRTTRVEQDLAELRTQQRNVK